MNTITRQINNASSVFDGVLASPYHRTAAWLIVGVALYLLVCRQVTARPAHDRDDRLPKIVVITAPSPAADEHARFRSLRAQLSGTRVRLHRVASPLTTKHAQARPQIARQLAHQTGASMLVWIDDAPICRTVYYLPNAQGGKFIERTLALKSDITSSRNEYIAIAVSTMIEQFAASRQLFIPSAPPKKQSPAPPPEPKPPSTSHRNHALAAAYSGTVFSQNRFQHGVFLTAMWRFHPRFLLGVAFTPTAAVQTTSENLRLSIVSRTAEVSFAVKVLDASVKVHTGIGYAIDFRSFSTTRLTTTFQRSHAGLTAVNLIVPHITAIWRVSTHIGILTRIDGSIGVNETRYDTSFDAEQSTFISPFGLKPSIRVGVHIDF